MTNLTTAITDMSNTLTLKQGNYLGHYFKQTNFIIFILFHVLIYNYNIYI